MDTVILTLVTFFIISVLLVVVILNVIASTKDRKYKKDLDNLGILKNTIIDIPVLNELTKVEGLIKNKKLEEKYKRWHEDFKVIKEKKIPKVTDMILDADYLIEKKDYKNAVNKMAKIELEIHNLKSKSDIILNEIKTVTTSEEKNRTLITKLKSKYRELYTKFSNNKKDYDEFTHTIELKFETVEKSFQKFEILMETNEYEEVDLLIKSINNSLNSLNHILNEAADIILIGRTIIPKKIDDISKAYSLMIKDGYPLDYLSIEYNIEEIAKKINIIFDKLKRLDIVDSLFELKVFMEYFEQIFKTFENEKSARKEFIENLSLTKKKIIKINKIVEHIYINIDSIKSRYSIEDSTLNMLENNKQELSTVNYQFQSLIDQSNGKSFAFSALLKELKTLKKQVAIMEMNLDNTLNSIGNMQEDEKRAKQQLEDIKTLLKKAKFKIRKANLPSLNDNYFIQLKEASEAIREIVKEIEKKPIDINVLNIRVDTGRDLVFKFYKTTNDLIKTARFAEKTIVYANKYRTKYPLLDKNLFTSEQYFLEGDYTKAFEITINSINEIEPGIKDKIVKAFTSTSN